AWLEVVAGVWGYLERGLQTGKSRLLPAEP
ncbi:MAG: hypothetical protein ACI9MB_004803, partial [Verrucomicrobiales bacterium]